MSEENKNTDDVASTGINRRNFLAAVGALTAGAITPAFGQVTAPAYSDKDEYLFAPGLIYMNTGTIGPCSKKTIEETAAAWKELESLPLKFYAKRYAPSLAEKTRTTAAAFLGCDLDEIMITKSTTEGMNAIAQGLRLQPGDRIITTNQEHDGGLNGWNYMAKYHGVFIDTVNIPFDANDASKILERISMAITPMTKIISISHIFSSTGLRLPVADISILARSKNILCIVDGAQAVGAIKVNVKELGCHAYAGSGHKWLMGPKGTGLLYISKEVQDIIRPMQFEDSHNTFNESSGVGNLPGILGLGVGIEHINMLGIEKIEQHNMDLRNRLYKALLSETKLAIQSPPPGPLATPLLSCRLPESIDATAFSFKFLETHKISFRPVHKKWFNGIRFSLHVFNTEKEVDKLVDIIKKEL
jgi:selenocysteine lyase/cysteine desulfurase